MDDEDRLELELAEDCTTYIEDAVMETLRAILGDKFGGYDMKCASAALMLLVADMSLTVGKEDFEIHDLLDLALDTLRDGDDDGEG